MFYGIHLRATLQEVFMNFMCSEITLSALKPYLSKVSELMYGTLYIYNSFSVQWTHDVERALNESLHHGLLVLKQTGNTRSRLKFTYPIISTEFKMSTHDIHAVDFLLSCTPGGRLKIKMLSYQHRNSHVKDKTVSPTILSLTWESPYLEKTVFILRRGPGSYGYEIMARTSN